MQPVVSPPVNPARATAEQVCGACLHFRPAAGEPTAGHRYGHCIKQMAIAREASAFYPQISTYDDTSRCTIVRSPAGVPAFEPRAAT